LGRSEGLWRYRPDEYNPDLRGRSALQIAEKMRRTTGQIRALEQIIRIRIGSPQWIVEEPRQVCSAEGGAEDGESAAALLFRL
jgi:hypothetical protein